MKLRMLLTILLSCFVSLSGVYAACVQSLDIGNQDLSNTNNLEVDYIFSNANGNITIKNTLVMDIDNNKTILVGNVTASDSNYTVVNKGQVMPSGRVKHIWFSTSTTNGTNMPSNCSNKTDFGSTEWYVAVGSELVDPNTVRVNSPVNDYYSMQVSPHGYSGSPSSYQSIMNINPVTFVSNYTNHSNNDPAYYACVSWQ